MYNQPNKGFYQKYFRFSAERFAITFMNDEEDDTVVVTPNKI